MSGGHGHQGMEINVILERTDPPAGRLRAIGTMPLDSEGPSDEVRFVGWLGLLRALSEVMGARDAPASPEP